METGLRPHLPRAMTPALDLMEGEAATEGPSVPPFERVYRDQFSFVFRSLRHLGVRTADLEDAVQDVFVVVHKKLGTFERRARLSTWIYGICLNTAHARRRRAHARHEEPTDPALMPEDPNRDVAASAEATLAQREAEEMLDRILDALPIEQRAVFTLFELDGETCEAIAALCDIPIGTVYSRLRLARAAFERAVARLEARERTAR